MRRRPGKREIEEILYSHPDIEDVYVIGVLGERYGEELCACIKTKAGVEPLDVPAIRAFANGQLARRKSPPT